LRSHGRSDSQRTIEIGPDYRVETDFSLGGINSPQSELSFDSEASSVNIKCPRCQQENRLDTKVFKDHGGARPIKCYQCEQIFEYSLNGFNSDPESKTDRNAASDDSTEYFETKNKMSSRKSLSLDQISSLHDQFSFRSGSDIGNPSQIASGILSSSSLSQRKPCLVLENEEDSQLISDSVKDGSVTDCSELSGVEKVPRWSRQWFEDQWKIYGWLFPYAMGVLFCIILFFIIRDVRSQVYEQNIQILRLQHALKHVNSTQGSVDLRAVKAQNQQLKSQLMILTETTTQLDGHVNEITPNVEKMKKNVQNFGTEVDAHSSRINQLFAKTSDHEDQISTHEAQISDHEVQISDDGSRIDNLQSVSGNHTQEIIKSASIIMSVLQHVEKVKSNVDIHGEQIREQDRMVDGLVRDVQILKRSVSKPGATAVAIAGGNTAGQIAAYAHRIEKLEAASATAVAVAGENTAGQIAAYARRIEKLEVALAADKSKIGDLATKVGQLEEGGAISNETTIIVSNKKFTQRTDTMADSFVTCPADSVLLNCYITLKSFTDFTFYAAPLSVQPKICECGCQQKRFDYSCQDDGAICQAKCIVQN